MLSPTGISSLSNLNQNKCLFCFAPSVVLVLGPYAKYSLSSNGCLLDICFRYSFMFPLIRSNLHTVSVSARRPNSRQSLGTLLCALPQKMVGIYVTFLYEMREMRMYLKQYTVKLFLHYIYSWSDGILRLAFWYKKIVMATYFIS